MELHQSDKKYLVYEDRIEQPADEERPVLHSNNSLEFWSDRIALIQGKHTREFWHFQAFDLLTNESRPISFPKSDSLFHWVEVFPLVNNYGFIIEELYGHRCIVKLVKIHWNTSKIQVFEQFERQVENGMEILVDKMQPSKFILKIDRTYRVCELNDGKIEFGDVHTTDNFDHYFNDKLFVFANYENEIIEIRTYDLLSKKTQSFQIEALPGYHVRQWHVEWIKNRVYAVVGSQDTRNFGIAWTDSETKRLTLLDLTTTVYIRQLKCLNGNLLALGKRSNRQSGIFKSTVQIHSIPIHRPHSLRQMAWLIVVQQMKDSGELDPYKAAARYLPLNTDLRAPWFNDEATDSQGKAMLDQRENESIQDEVLSKRHKPN